MKDLDKFKNDMNLSGKNVYVGHRYVPKLDGDWDNSKTYEALTIVQYQGNSFTSRQFVPTGVDINNEEFWVSTGNYNAQIEAYRKEVRDMDNRILEVEGKNELTIERLNSRGIYPDDLEGANDFEKVQNAFDKAISEGRSVNFERMYDITGHTIAIHKSTIPRKLFYIKGEGGGLIKNDSGYFYTGSDRYVSDVISQNMVYQSTSGAGAVVFNGDSSNGIIRLTTEKDTYLNVDSVINSPNNFIQSVRIIGNTITGGKGWAIEFKSSYDTTIMDNTIEHRENGIRNTGNTRNPDNNTLRIENNVIEGLTGKGLYLGSSFGVIIKGNYMENNGEGYFDLTLSNNYHNGLTLIGNTIQQSEEQIVSKVPAFKMGLLGDGVSAEGNISTGVLFETTKAGTAGRIISIGSYSYSGELELPSENRIVREFGRNRTTENSIISGSVELYRNGVSGVLFAANETKLLSIPFENITKVDNKSLISIDTVSGSGDGKVQILRWSRDIAQNGVLVEVKNTSTNSQNINAYVSILQIRY